MPQKTKDLRHKPNVNHQTTQPPSKTILCIVLGAVAARPGHASGTAYLPAAPAIYDHYEHYAPTIVGHSVEHYPTAVSHQSQTIVHEKRPYLRPIVEYAPAATFVKAHAPIIKKYVVAAAPAIEYAYAPESYYTGSGELYATSGWGDAGLAYTTTKGGWNAWPLK
ncbi:uncharacterized protein LOC101891939 [Musca domestica]|uniref:Uncharacterized protein LOC101891939 n=1 Tax=Musca domestica TaxID=7370 RepID=A0A1I8ND73_MUSDO|nr:uncharacterized protein LOC101891939 [Musca domestica]